MSGVLVTHAKRERCAIGRKALWRMLIHESAVVDVTVADRVSPGNKLVIEWLSDDHRSRPGRWARSAATEFPTATAHRGRQRASHEPRTKVHRLRALDRHLPLRSERLTVYELGVRQRAANRAASRSAMPRWAPSHRGTTPDKSSERNDTVESATTSRSAVGGWSGGCLAHAGGMNFVPRPVA